MEEQSFKLLSKASTFLDWAKVARVREAAPRPCRAARGHGAMGPCGQCQPRIQPHVTASSSQTRASARFAKAKYELCVWLSQILNNVPSRTVQYSPVQSSTVQYFVPRPSVRHTSRVVVPAFREQHQSSQPPTHRMSAAAFLFTVRLSQLLPDPCPLRWHLIRRPPAGLQHQFVFIFPSSSDRDAHYRGSQLERPDEPPTFACF